MNVSKKHKQGSIYLVRMHPSYGNELKKFRPAIIMFDSIDSRFVTIAPLTTQLNIMHKQLETIIKPTKSNQLDQQSLLLSWYLETIDISRLQKHLGKLDSKDMTRLKNSLTHLIS